MLKGTEKQVAWAEDIIGEARRTIEGNIERIKVEQEKHGIPVMQDYLEAYARCGETLENMLSKIDSASKIIEMRDRISSREINRMVDQYVLIQKNKNNK